MRNAILNSSFCHDVVLRWNSDFSPAFACSHGSGIGTDVFPASAAVLHFECNEGVGSAPNEKYALYGGTHKSSGLSVTDLELECHLKAA